MFHLAAWYEDIDPGGVLTPITAVVDQSVFTSGDDIRVPTQMPNIVGQAALADDASAAAAQVQSPSLRAMVNLDIEPVVAAAVFGSPPEILFHPQSPISVVADEPVNFALNSDPAAVEDHYGLVWFGDGPQQPALGNIFSVGATSAVTLAAGTWVNGVLAFAQTLPLGRYTVVGMRARGTNLVAARLVFVGGAFRPGVPAVNALADRDPDVFRYGRHGTFGVFHSNTPPTVDCLGVTDAAQSYVLDLLQVA
jgi:hypothetical protein